MNIRWRRPRIKSPYSSLFYSDFVFVFPDLVSSFIFFFFTKSHINYFTSGWYPGPWVRKFVVGSLTLFHCKKAVQAQVCLKWAVVLMVSQEAYPGAIPGTKEGSDAFPTTVSMWWNTVWILQKASKLWINRLQILRSHLQPTTHQAHQNLSLKPTKTDTAMGKATPCCYELLMK